MPTSPKDSGEKILGQVIDKNIEHLEQVRRDESTRLSKQDRFAQFIAKFAGSMASVYFHGTLFGLWLLVNSEILPIVDPFDPYPFVMLAMFASVEAIFLSTFVLINQNQMGAVADRRADLNLHMTLLTEHELTRLIRITNLMATQMGIDIQEKVKDIDHIQEDIRPDQVLDRIHQSDSKP